MQSPWHHEIMKKKKRKWKHLSRNTQLGFIFTVMDYPAPPVSKSVFKSLKLKCQVASSNGRTAHCWHSWMLSGIMNSNVVARLGSVFRKTPWIWMLFIWKSAPFGIILPCLYPQSVLWTKRLLVLHLSQTGQGLDDSEPRPFWKCKANKKRPDVRIFLLIYKHTNIFQTPNTGSTEERTVLEKAEEYGCKREKSSPPAADVDVVLPNLEISVGDNFELNVEFINKSDERRTVDAYISGSVVYYTGVASTEFLFLTPRVAIDPKTSESGVQHGNEEAESWKHGWLPNVDNCFSVTLSYAQMSASMSI